MSCKNPNCDYYPYYGLAPHKHIGVSVIGSTVIDEKEAWPKNFSEDPEAEGMGVWSCPDCIVSEVVHE